MSKVSDDILMEFMKKTDASVLRIEKSVSSLVSDQGILKTNLDNHIKEDESKKELKEDHARALDRKNWAIGLLVGVIIFFLGYIWGGNTSDKIKNNVEEKRLQERTEKSPG